MTVLVSLAASLALQLVISEPVTSVPEPTLESVTVPLFRLDCRLHDPDGRTYTLKLAQEGGRGYEVAGETHPFQRFRTTRITMKVLQDDTGEFLKRELSGEWIDSSRPHRIGAAIYRQRNGKRDVELDSIMTLRFESAEAGRLSLVVSAQAELFIAYVGFCNLSSTPQLPIKGQELSK